MNNQEQTTTTTTEIKPIFVFDIKHVELQSTISKVAHENCFKEQYNLLPNYTAKVDRACENARARCEFCGEVLNAAEAKREIDALTKWLTTGDRTDYTAIKDAQRKTAGQSKTIRIPATTGKFTSIGATTGRFSSKTPNLSTRPSTTPQDVINRLRKRKAQDLGGVTSGDTKIVTLEEKRLAQMNQLSEDELFDTK